MSIAPTQAEIDAMEVSSRDPEIQRAGNAMVAGDLYTAEAALRGVLAKRPNDFVAIRMLGQIAASVGVLGDAEALYRQALQLAPGFAFARLHLAAVLHDQDRPAEALGEFAKIGGDLLSYPETKALHADMFERVGDYPEAIALYREIAAADPANLDAWTRLAFLLKTVGKTDEAIEACRAALRQRPEHGEAWWLLADFKSFKFSDEDIARLEQAIASPLPDDDLLRLHFALGKALEDRKQPAESFRHYSAGNRMRAAQIAHDPGMITGFVDRSIALFTAPFLAAHAGAGDPAPDPIFVLGLPRSGSTLVEQILASNPLIEGTAELPYIYALIREMESGARANAGTPYPELIADLSDERLREMGAIYLERVRAHRKTDRPFFIDKMPNNWMHIGFIQLILPNAKIVDTRRHPLATGFSNFKQLYSTGQEFSYDLRHFGQHYADYVRMMAHFDQVSPGRIHRITHERLVADTEGEVRRLLDALGLPFDEACLRFHESKRPVKTASAEQVRQPIRKDATEDWRAFEAELEPLKQALGATLEHWDGSDNG